MKMKNHISLVSAIVSTFILFSCQNKNALKVSVEKVEERTVIETVSASGKIEPEVEVKISSEVSGEITGLYVKEGDSVQKGQLLAEINPDLLQSQFEGSQAMYNNAMASYSGAVARKEQSKATYVQAEADYNRQKTLFDKNVISQSEYDAAKAKFEGAKADLKAAEENVKAADYSARSAQSNAKLAGSNLSRTRLYAPMSGIVSKLSVEKGERVVGTATMSGTELLRIADLSVMQVDVQVNENDIIRLRLGDTATINVDAYPENKFKGIVTEIANSPILSSGATSLSTNEVTNFEVKVQILPSSYAQLSNKRKINHSPFRPGMSATVDIQTEKQKGIAVPIQSVTAKSQTGENVDLNAYNEYVFVLDGDSVNMKLVKTSIQDNKHIIITEGLKGDETVVDAPYEAISKTLAQGSKVLVTTKDKLFTDKK